jgi:hypothetical protein
MPCLGIYYDANNYCLVSAQSLLLHEIKAKIIYFEQKLANGIEIS